MRSCGILMPIFSLPSKYGIGTFGKEAFNFVDFLKRGGQSYWQILPLNPTNYGDSPYQSFSSFAGNPYFIDLDILEHDGLLKKTEIDACDFGDDSSKIDYGKLYLNRYPLLKKAFCRFKPNDEYEKFAADNAFWLDDYALFMALKSAKGGISWQEWDTALKKRESEAVLKAEKEYADVINFHKFLQFEFDCQWKSLKQYANQNGIKIIGDIPIYAALDSADVWANPKQFMLNLDYKPKKVAGVPPDAFSSDGQLWGNPLYDWNYMKRDNYGWYCRYVGNALSKYDITRIDHFRGFESYFAIPFDSDTAKDGAWEKGPDTDLFDALKAKFGDDLPIIAEDLGVITPAVRKLLKATGFAGMKVLQFGFNSDSKNDYLPHNYDRNCVVYVGTHDNDTVMGWYENEDANAIKNAQNYLNFYKADGFNWAMIKCAMSSVADTCILTMQDIMGLGSEGRINTPSTVGDNWTWRISDGCINDWLADILKANTVLYGR